MQQSGRSLHRGKRGASSRKTGFIVRMQWFISALSVVIIILYAVVYRLTFHPDGGHHPSITENKQELMESISRNVKRGVSRASFPGVSESLPSVNAKNRVQAETVEALSDKHIGTKSSQNAKDEYQDLSKPELKSYNFWRELAVQLAGRPAQEVLDILETRDPFGVRTFEKKLLEEESRSGAFVDQSKLSNLFACPSTDRRITVPDQRDETKARAFRDESASIQSGSVTASTETFLFFQHLRKAGGTNFCSLAEHNLPRKNLPPYYCMPDYHWKHDEGKTALCAGCAIHWTNEEIEKRMSEGHHRIYGNEWDPFDASRFFDLPALFATSFRRPLDRALSQFRFECIEDRGCKIKVIEEWWKKRTDLTNVYTWTFANQPVRRITVTNSPSSIDARRHAVGTALDTVARFHLVMAMEWLAYAPKHVTEVLGFEDTTAMTTRVRPHIGNHARNDGQEKNSMGAAGIAKASWTPKDYLSTEQYKIMSEDLALDEILTDAARRMFLERLVCGNE